MHQYVSTVTRKGQVTIPGPIRKALNIQPKDTVAFSFVDGQVLLRPIRSSLLAGYASVKPHNRPEDFRRMRQEIEQEIADEVFKEG
jgi:AbrB family looped-hinge helix DNA binding protein